jgi:hypothetical protein
MKKWLLIILAVLIGAGIALYQNANMRAYFDAKTEQLLPKQLSQHKLYRWHDRQGHVHLSDIPPDAGIRYETVEYDSKTNVLPAEALTGKKKPQ